MPFEEPDINATLKNGIPVRVIEICVTKIKISMVPIRRLYTDVTYPYNETTANRISKK